MTDALPVPLFSRRQIAARIRVMAGEIATAPVKPDMIAPILVGAFVFAADLIRALANEGIHPLTEMLWLRSYGDKRVANEISVIHGPSKNVHGRHILIVDGVLDAGRSVQKAVTLLRDAGAASVRIAVVVDKRRDDAILRADFACFCDVEDFIAGYGMDDAGRYRDLPYVGRVVV